jgi:transaldolase
MRLFLDTANIEQIRRAAGMGLISGVTTNPTLVAKEGSSNLKDRILEICSIVDGSISVEVLSLDAEGMIREAREVAAWHKNVTIKIPVSEAGYEAISVLSKEGIKTNLTLCFSPTQTLLGARAGATYVSPFVGRLDDIGHRGMDVVSETVEIFAKHNIEAQVIAASIRHPLHVIEAARCGSHIATVPYDVLMKLIKHPLTDAGIDRFIEDWKKVKP